jgi:hypothetical protein
VADVPNKILGVLSTWMGLPSYNRITLLCKSTPTLPLTYIEKSSRIEDMEL